MQMMRKWQYSRVAPCILESRIDSDGFLFLLALFYCTNACTDGGVILCVIKEKNEFKWPSGLA